MTPRGFCNLGNSSAARYNASLPHPLPFLTPECAVRRPREGADAGDDIMSAVVFGQLKGRPDSVCMQASVPVLLYRRLGYRPNVGALHRLTSLITDELV